jgi:hypothetical protein
MGRNGPGADEGSERPLEFSSRWILPLRSMLIQSINEVE